MNLEQLRNLMPVTKRCIFLNHCAVSPLPVPVKEKIEEVIRDQASEGLEGLMAHFKPVPGLKTVLLNLPAPAAKRLLSHKTPLRGLILLPKGWIGNQAMKSFCRAGNILPMFIPG